MRLLHPAALALSAALGLFVGGRAFFAPSSFYDSFPGVLGSWIHQDGPFNEHLIRDVGAMYLALALASIGALIWRHEAADRVLGIAWTVFGVLHFGAQARGHEVVVISRRNGHDLETGVGLSTALAGADAVVDVTSVTTTSRTRAVRFFTTVTRTLLAAERAAAVGHHVALSIVGIDGVDASYYAGKLAHEREIGAGSVPLTLQRATQFHEFAEQVVPRGSLGPLVAVPTALIRPIAAREAGERLVELAEAGPAGRVTDLVGPRDERLIEMVRAMFAADGVKRPTLELSLPGSYWRATASGVLRGAGERLEGRIPFTDWLRSADHTPLAH